MSYRARQFGFFRWHLFEIGDVGESQQVSNEDSCQRMLSSKNGHVNTQSSNYALFVSFLPVKDEQRQASARKRGSCQVRCVGSE